MADNSITVVGNLTRDPEIRYTASGQAKAQLGIAVSRRWQNRQTNEWEERTSFFNVVCWGDMAENVSDSVAKGTRVIVNGRLEQRSWETEQGEKRSVVEIIADEVGSEPALGDGRGEALRATWRWRRRRWWRWRRRLRWRRWRRRRAPARRPGFPTRAARRRVRRRRAFLSTQTGTERRDHGKRSRTARQGLEGRRPKAHAQEEGVDPQPGQHRLGRLQGRQPAAALHVGAGEDPGAPRHGQQRAAAARGGPGDPGGPRDGVAAVQRPPGDPAEPQRSSGPGRPGGSLGADADARCAAARRVRARRAARGRDGRSGRGDRRSGGRHARSRR